MFESISNWLPQQPGLLPYYLLYSCFLGISHTIICFLSSPEASMIPFRGPNAPPPTRLQAHIYGAKNFYTVIIRAATAYNLPHTFELYCLCWLTFFGVFALYSTETFLYKTVRLREATIPLFYSSLGMVWMWLRTPGYQPPRLKKIISDNALPEKRAYMDSWEAFRAHFGYQGPHRYSSGTLLVNDKMIITAEEAKKWLIDSHAASATLNTTHWLSTFFSPSITLIYANLPPISGRDNVYALFDVFLSRLSEMTHHIETFDYVEQEQKILQAARITYVVKGGEGRKIEIPGFAAFTLEKDGEGEVRVVRAQTWLDPSPVTEGIVGVYGREEWEGEMGRLMETVTVKG